MEINALCEREEVKNAIRESFPDVHVYEYVLPHVFRSGYEDEMKAALSMDEVVVRTIDELGFLKKNSYKGHIIGDTYLYTMNSSAVDSFRSMGVYRDTLPLELTYRELKERETRESEITVYGRVPLMVSAQCVYRDSHDDICKKKEKGRAVYLKDRTGRILPCVCFCRYCYNVIFNSVPLSLHNLMDEVVSLKPAGIRLYFSTEDPKEACAITGYYRDLLIKNIKNAEFPLREYTTGHFKKGVE